MPIPITPKPQFPDVPLLPGVPIIPRAQGIAAIQSNIVLGVADAANILSLVLQQRWGIFTQDGADVFSLIPGLAGLGLGVLVNGLIAGALSNLAGVAQSVIEFEYRNNQRIATAPQEQGAFVSYNKVANPYRSRVTYAVSGPVPLRSNFISQVQALIGDTNLYTVVMPEFVYANANIVDYDVHRTARRGVSMMFVDISVEEVRITATSQFSQTQSPNGATPTDQGSVQPGVPTSVQSSSLPAGAVT